MAASGYSPIQLYYSTTASAAPTAGNLASGELAINITDGKLYYKDNAGAVQLLSTSTTANGTANGVLYLNGSKVATAGSALVFDGTNLGVGVTPSAWSGRTAIQLPDLGYFVTSGSSLLLGSNVYFNGSSRTYITTAAAADYRQINGEHRWEYAPSGTAGTAITFTQAMTLDASGRWQLGTTDVLGKATVSLTSPGSLGTVVNVASFGINGVFSLGGVTNNSDGVYLGTGDANAGGKVASGIGFLREGSGWNSALAFYTNNVTSGPNGVSAISERARIDSSGNLGLGVTPSAWLANSQAIQNSSGALWQYGGANIYLGQNYYLNGSVQRIYATSAAATEYNQAGGAHRWYTAPSGTAGNPISFTQAMTLDASGNLGIGTSSPSSKLHVVGTSHMNVGAYANGYALTISASSETSRTYQIGMVTGGNLAIYDSASSATRLTLDTSGNLGLGVTPSSSWSAVNGPALQIGAFASVFNNSSLGSSEVAYNTIRSGSDAYVYNITGIAASRFQQRDGTFRFFTAPSGTAGNAITFTQAMTLDASSRLGIGTTSPATGLDVSYVPDANWGTINAFDPTTTAANVGGVLAFSGYKTATSNKAIFAKIQGAKENATSGNEAGFLAFYTNNNSAYVERMRLDSSGNLGLGVTPSNWTTAASVRALQVGPRAALWADTTQTILSNNMYTNSGDKYIATAAAALYAQNAGQHLFFTAPSGTAGAAISFTQAMTLDASGRLGIGTTSPTDKLHVDGGASSTYIKVVGQSATAYFGQDTVGLTVYQKANKPIYFVTNDTERARIDSSGRFLVYAQTSGGLGVTVDGDGGSAPYFIVNSNSATGAPAYFRYQGTTVGSITTTTTTTSYNITSDQRLKENIQDADSASSLIDSLQVRKFDWKSDGSHQRYGFVAQELVTVAPEAVHQPADPEEMMAVDYSKLVPMLVKEIQSLRKRLADAGIA